MSSEKRSSISVPNTDAQGATAQHGHPDEPPPSYEEAVGAETSNAQPSHEKQCIPEYSEKTAAKRTDLRSIPMWLNNKIVAVPIPPTALYLLGLEEDTDEKKKDQESDTINPEIFEFELVCLDCMDYESECGCSSSSPRLGTFTSKLHQATRPYGTFPCPPGLVEDIRIASTHTASAMAHVFWPVICQGMIPIFTDEFLVIIRSRVMERAASAKEFLSQLGKPILKIEQTSCECGCEKHVCEKIVPRYGNPNYDEVMKKTKTIIYTTNGRSFTTVRMANGTTRISMKELGLLDITTSEESDFMLYCSLLPSLEPLNPFPAPKDPALFSWDFVLNSLLAEILCCKNMSKSRYQCVPLKRMSHHKRGTCCVIRSEMFGVGTGYLVLDTSIRVDRVNDPVKDQQMFRSEAINSSLIEQRGFRSIVPESQPKLQDCLRAPKGHGWTGVSFEKSADYPKLKKGFVIFNSTKTVLGLPGIPLRGYMCSGKCTEKGKRIMADCAGFTPPNLESGETTVYVLGKEPVPYIVVSQYAHDHPKPLFFVTDRQCLGCTVLEVPRGSVVAGMLPSFPIYLLDGA